MKYLYSILTVNTAHYEKLHEVQNPNPNVEYVCVTDDEELKSETWKIIYKKNIWFLDVKHNVFEYISTDVCLWLDGSYQITDDPTNDFVMPFINSDKEMMISIHDKRTNIYDELCQWWIIRKISDNNIKALASILINNKVTGADCLFQTSCFLVKKTESVLEIYKNVKIIEKLCSVDSLYRDDQVIVSFCIYKLFPNWDKLVLMDFEHTSNNKFFHWCFHNTDKPHTAKQLTNRCFDKEQKLYKIGQNNSN